MCKAIDVARTMVNRSIDLAVQEKDDAYYMDIVKLHKLLYIAQCRMENVYGLPMFEETVFAHTCGPYVDGLDPILYERGYDKIRQKFDVATIALPSLLRLMSIDWTLRQYGRLRVETLTEFTKRTPGYVEVENEITDTYKPEINCLLRSSVRGTVMSR